MNTKVRKDLAQNLTQASVHLFSFLLPVGRKGGRNNNNTKRPKTTKKTPTKQKQTNKQTKPLWPETEKKKTWKIKPAIQDLPLCYLLNCPFSREGMIWCYVRSYKAFLENTPFSLAVQILVNVFNELFSSDEILNKEKPLVEAAINLAGITLLFCLVQYEWLSFSPQNGNWQKFGGLILSSLNLTDIS